MERYLSQSEGKAITDINMYLNPSLEAPYGAKVSFCPKCKINRLTALTQRSCCGTDCAQEIQGFVRQRKPPGCCT